MTVMHWRGVIAPLNQKDSVGRQIRMGATPNTRRLPLPLRYQPADFGGHHGAIQIGSIERVWVEGNKLYGAGRFDLADATAADVVRKIREGFVRHMSADIDASNGKLMAATIVDIPAFEEAEITDLDISSLDSEEAEAAELVGAYSAPTLVTLTYRVVGDVNLPVLADREREWDSDAAVDRVYEWAGGDNLDVDKYRRAFLWQKPDTDPSNKTAYSLPVADVVDGELRVIPRAVFAAAGAVEGARGGVNIPDSDLGTIRRRLERLYERVADALDDDSIRAPWLGSEELSAVVDVDTRRAKLKTLRHAAAVAALGEVA